MRDEEVQDTRYEIQDGVDSSVIPHPSSLNLVLTGFMGTGKSTLGKLCAAQMGFAFCDSDQIIEAQAGCSVAELFRELGEAGFRHWEKTVISELAATPNLVIATGGGAVLEAANVQNLRATGIVALLTASPEVILQRVGGRRSRPLLANAPDPHARIVEMLAQRLPLYEQSAHFQVQTDVGATREIAERIVRLYELAKRQE